MLEPISVTREEKHSLKCLHKSVYFGTLARYGLTSDWVLLSHLRAAQLCPKTAEAQLLKVFHLYEEVHIFNVRSMDVLSMLPRLRRSYNGGIVGMTVEGLPVMIEDWSQFDLWRLFQDFTTETLRKFFLHRMEMIVKTVFPFYSEKNNRRISSLFVVSNMKGLNYQRLKDPRVQELFKTLLENFLILYPNTLEELHFINCSSSMVVFVDWIKSLVPSSVSQKMFVHLDDGKQAILRRVDPTFYPFQLGGYGNNDLFSFTGPAHDAVKQCLQNRTVNPPVRNLEMKWFMGAAQCLDSDLFSSQKFSFESFTSLSSISLRSIDLPQDHYDVPGKMIGSSRSIIKDFKCSIQSFLPQNVVQNARNGIMLVSAPRQKEKHENLETKAHMKHLSNTLLERSQSLKNVSTEEKLLFSIENHPLEGVHDPNTIMKLQSILN